MAYMKDSKGRRLDSIAVVATPGTRVAAAALTAPNSTTTLGGAIDYTLRTLMAFPFATTRWRLKYRNRNLLSTVVPNGSAVITAVASGTPTRPTTGASSNANRWAGSATTMSTLTSTPVTVQNDGSWAYSPWFANAGDQFKPGTDKVISFGITAASGAVLASGNGYQWARGNGSVAVSTDALTGPTVGANVGYLDVCVEYEFDAAIKVLLVLGDSNSISYVEAEVSPLNGYASSGSLPSESWPATAGMMGGFAVINLAVGSSATNHFAPAGATYIPALWERIPAGTKIDAAVMALGTNFLSVSLTTFAADFLDINTKLRTDFSLSSLWWATIPPRGYPDGTYAGTGSAWASFLTADIALGVTTFTADRNLATGTAVLGAGGNGEDVTISSVTGTGPYTVTLSAATTKAHHAGERIGVADERLRMYKNAYLRLNPDGIRGVFDFERLLESAPGSWRMDDRYSTSQWLHCTRAANPVKAGAIIGTGVQPLFA
jgi:hypothetical protein